MGGDWMSGGRGRSSRQKIVVATAVLAAVTMSAAPSGAYQRPGQTELITTPLLGVTSVPSGRDADACNRGSAKLMDITPNGRFVVFVSAGTDLVEGDTNLACDVFLKDRRSGDLSRVSISSRGTQGLVPGPSPLQTFPDSVSPAISDDGRYIAFASWAQDLIDGDTNLDWDVFLHDTRTAMTRRVSVSSTGTQASGSSYLPSISGNGRLVGFTSSAADLVTDDVNEGSDGFIHDLREQKTFIVSVAPEGGQVTEGVVHGLSETGRFIHLYMQVLGNSTRRWVRDLKEDRTVPAEVGPEGQGPNETSGVTAPRGGDQISADGRYVVFGSCASNLVPNDRNGPIVSCIRGAQDIFVRDLKEGRTERVSINAFGEESPGFPFLDGHEGIRQEGGVAISANGRYVTFGGLEHYSPQEGYAGDTDVYIYDRKTGSVDWVSVDAWGGDRPQCGGLPELSGAAGLYASTTGAIDGSGRHVVFQSAFSCLVEGDANQFYYDVFVRNRGDDLGFGGEGSLPTHDPSDDKICIEPLDVCVPPSGAVSARDRDLDVGGPLRASADLRSTSLAFRPEYQDLFAAIEVTSMATLDMRTAGMFSTVTSTPLIYGLRFEVGDRRYEARASSLLGGTFGLFDCTNKTGSLCTKVADLRGGYGTTGERVVFSIPLGAVGLLDGGELSNVTAFSALGSHLIGTTKILDSMRVS